MRLTDQIRLVVGISGIMGSGKTTVARVFERHGAVRIDADAIGKQLLNNPEIKASLVRTFGRSILRRGGIEPRRLASVAFATRRATAKLNSITHPHLITRLKAEVERAMRLSPMIVVDAALLPEWNLTSVLDLLVVVDTPEEAAIRRSCRARAFRRDQVIARMRNQLSRSGKIRRADVVIPNFGSLEDLVTRASRLFWHLVEFACGR